MRVRVRVCLCVHVGVCATVNTLNTELQVFEKFSLFWLKKQEQQQRCYISSSSFEFMKQSQVFFDK